MVQVARKNEREKETKMRREIRESQRIFLNKIPGQLEVSFGIIFILVSIILRTKQYTL